MLLENSEIAVTASSDPKTNLSEQLGIDDAT
jgi:hypothetical protein